MIPDDLKQGKFIRHYVWLSNTDEVDFICQDRYGFCFFLFFFCFVALRPKSTAMVIAGRSIQLTTLFPGQACTSG